MEIDLHLIRGIKVASSGCIEFSKSLTPHTYPPSKPAGWGGEGDPPWRGESNVSGSIVTVRMVVIQLCSSEGAVEVRADGDMT